MTRTLDSNTITTNLSHSMTRTLDSNTTTAKLKFLYSYGGKLIPRLKDSKLCYVGGHTRVLAVDRSITFSELMMKFGELCGSSVRLKCKLPNEDLDVLVSITSDEDLRNLIEEYDRFDQNSKIRAILFPRKSLEIISPSSSTISSSDFSASSSPVYTVAGFSSGPPHAAAVTAMTAADYPYCGRNGGEVRRCASCRNPRNMYLYPYWNGRLSPKP